MALTHAEGVIPPIGATQIRFQIVGGTPDDDDRRGDERPNDEEHGENRQDNAQPLQQIHVGDLDGLRRPHAEYYRNPMDIYHVKTRSKKFLK